MDCCDASGLEAGSGYTARVSGSSSTRHGAGAGRTSDTTNMTALPGVSGADGWLLRIIKDRRVAFLLVGMVNTVVGGLWFVVFDSLVGALWGVAGHYVALALTYVAAILCAFVLYRKLVFRVHGHVFRDLLRFASVYASSFLMNVALFAVLHNGLGADPLVAQLVNIGVISVMSYLLHRDFSFARRGEPRPNGRDE